MYTRLAYRQHKDKIRHHMEKLRYRKLYDWDSGGYYLGREEREKNVELGLWLYL